MMFHCTSCEPPAMVPDFERSMVLIADTSSRVNASPAALVQALKC